MQLARHPWALVPNKIVRYPGGREIDRFRGIEPPQDDGRPEAWVGSVTPVAHPSPQNPYDGCAEVVLPDGRRRYLFQALSECAEEALGTEHVQQYGQELGLLVKLLDAQQQLGLQCHPSREYARSHFDSPFGKHESWYIIGLRTDTAEPPYVLLGFREGVTRAQFEAAYDRGDVDALHALCHKVPVSVGDVFNIGPGLVHAVGPGCFLVEVQEPSDITVGATPLRTATAAQQAAHRERLLGAYDYTGRSYEENLATWRVQPQTLRQGPWGRERQMIGPEQTPYFSFTELQATAPVDLRQTGRAQIGLVLAGKGVLQYDGGSRPLQKADELFFPAAMTGAHLLPDPDGLTLVLCHPPR